MSQPYRRIYSIEPFDQLKRPPKALCVPLFDAWNAHTSFGRDHWLRFEKPIVVTLSFCFAVCFKLVSYWLCWLRVRGPISNTKRFITQDVYLKWPVKRKSIAHEQTTKLKNRTQFLGSHKKNQINLKKGKSFLVFITVWSSHCDACFQVKSWTIGTR